MCNWHGRLLESRAPTFPQPFGPSSICNEPLRIRRLTPFRTSRVELPDGKDTRRSSATIASPPESSLRARKRVLARLDVLAPAVCVCGQGWAAVGRRDGCAQWPGCHGTGRLRGPGAAGHWLVHVRWCIAFVMNTVVRTRQGAEWRGSLNASVQRRFASAAIGAPRSPDVCSRVRHRPKTISSAAYVPKHRASALPSQITSEAPHTRAPVSPPSACTQPTAQSCLWCPSQTRQ